MCFNAARCVTCASDADGCLLYALRPCVAWVNRETQQHGAWHRCPQRTPQTNVSPQLCSAGPMTPTTCWALLCSWTGEQVCAVRWAACIWVMLKALSSHCILHSISNTGSGLCLRMRYLRLRYLRLRYLRLRYLSVLYVTGSSESSGSYSELYLSVKVSILTKINHVVIFWLHYTQLSENIYTIAYGLIIGWNIWNIGFIKDWC